jgi:uncharacterized protein
VKDLRLSPELALPADFITQTAAILAIRGAGKSNLAAVLAEQMFAANLPFVVIDPTGTWVGLRSAGTGPGLGVVIFGGRERDVPLERGSGPAIADLIAEERLSSVVDVSELSEGDKVRFLTDFAKRLYRQNRDPLHLILEEADDYVPQKPFRDQAECLRAFQDIVRRGRARGLGITMVTQRSAVVSKDVLTQIETLFVLRTTSPQDRKAIEAWVDYHGQSRELVASLPSLKPGEAWVWSPHYLGTVARIQVNRRTTLDSAATPKDARGRRPPATKADVDLDAVTRAMVETIERAKAEDPKELRRRIAELERQVAAKPVPAKPEIRTVDVPVVKDAHLARLEASLTRAEKIAEKLTVPLEQLQQVAVNARAAAQEIRTAIAAAKAPVPLQRAAAGPSPSSPPRQPRAPRERPTLLDPSITPAKQRILNALAWLASIGLAPADRTQLALLAEQSPSSSGYANNLGSLRSSGLIDYPGGGLVTLTITGAAAAVAPDAPPTAEALHRQLERLLPPAKWRILRVLIDADGEPVDRDVLAEAADQSPTSSGYANNLGSLRSLGLIDYPERGRVVARPVLFLEGARA